MNTPNTQKTSLDLDSHRPGMKIFTTSLIRLWHRLKATKPALMGIALAFGLAFSPHEAAAQTGEKNTLQFVFKGEMTNTGVEPLARGKVDANLNLKGYVGSQKLALTLDHLTPNTAYQLVAYFGDESTPRGVASFTTNSMGVYAVTYVLKSPAQPLKNKDEQRLPNAIDPISHIHQLDILKAGVAVLTVVFGGDLQTDSVQPTVSSTLPANAATGVATNQAVAVTFSEEMNSASVNKSTFTLKQGNKSVSGVYTHKDSTVVFTPNVPLLTNTLYTATVTTGAKDLVGNPLEATYTWSFTTGMSADNSAPTVLSTVPEDSADDIPVTQTLVATFNEAMNPSTLNSSTFLLTGPGSTSVTGTVNYDSSSRTVTLAPGAPLEADREYTATLTTGVRDLAGNALAANFVWSFTTALTTTGQASVPLGTAADFAVLAGSTVANASGGTTVNGDLGVSPGSAVTGFPPGIVNGTIHNTTPGDAATAQDDLTTAYNDAEGRTQNPTTIAGNIGGMTLTPGLYKSTTSLEISSGDLTLDAQGDADAIFIFQIASTLTTTSGRHVILSGGAKAANIFWQVGTSATLGTHSVIKGTIMADQSVTATTGATLDGRALSRIAAINLDSNIVTIPSP